MKALLIYPEFPDTFWSFKYALSFVAKKASFPPLGLLTIANMLPGGWEKRVRDLNVAPLRKKDLEWADVALVSGMSIQKSSARAAIDRCKEAGLLVVGGGPLFSMDAESFQDVDHLILNEAEITLPRFLADLEAGRPRHVYATDSHADLSETPVPAWELAPLRRYHSLAIQYSRGCPFDCEFCNITSLLGRRVRTKSSEQIIAELDAAYSRGWRGQVFFVDDNFIGNRRRLKADLLPALIAWREGKRGITFHTEASINLADDPELIELMAAAGFDAVFVGIETPDDVGLSECGKKQNRNRDLVADVRRLQRAGLQVQGGFIVGFDSDDPSVFGRQIDFIQRSGIVTAMVGLLQAPQGTRLYKRMMDEGRLLGTASGDNVEGTTNIRTLMDPERLHAGYRRILDHIYSPRHYYERVKTLLREFKKPEIRFRPHPTDLLALGRSIVQLGVLGKERLQYWKLLLWTAFRRPSLLPFAIQLAISGYHFRKVCELHVR
ncbi:MAG: B12-binding domain-containing radical SAM protein [Polyangia bacterium]